MRRCIGLAALLSFELLERRLHCSFSQADAPAHLVAPPVIAVPQRTFDGKLAEINGALPPDPWVRIDWGDGTRTTGAIEANARGTHDVVARHEFDDDSWFNPYVFAELMSGSEDVDAANSRVLSYFAGEMANTEDVGLQAVNGEEARLNTFFDAHPVEPSHYDVEIDWGDETTSSGIVREEEGGGGVFIVYGTHTYDALDSERPYSVTVTVSRQSASGGEPATLQSWGQLYVVAPDSPDNGQAHTGEIEPIPGGEWSHLDTTSLTVHAILGKFKINVPSDTYDASVWWGDGDNEAGVVTVNDDGTVTVSGRHTYARSGEYEAWVDLNGSSGAMAYGASATLRVGPEELFLDDTGFGATIPQSSTPFGLDLGTFIDRAALEESSYEVRVDWGDGTAIDQGGVRAFGDGTCSVVGNHGYAQAGSYEVSVTVRRAGASVTIPGSFEVYAWDGPVDPPAVFTPGEVTEQEALPPPPAAPLPLPPTTTNSALPTDPPRADFALLVARPGDTAALQSSDLASDLFGPRGSDPLSADHDEGDEIATLLG